MRGFDMASRASITCKRCAFRLLFPPLTLGLRYLGKATSMEANSLTTFIEAVRSAWGPLTTEVVGQCRRQLQELLAASASEPWLTELHRTAPASQELYRDPDHGFLLLAHFEREELYRPPHDHGRGWVLYAMQRGAIEMGDYARVEQPGGTHRLVERDRALLSAGQVRAYLPGDVHDTRCMSKTALLFRFTDRDLRQEQGSHRLTRYADAAGVWSPAAA